MQVIIALVCIATYDNALYPYTYTLYLLLDNVASSDCCTTTNRSNKKQQQQNLNNFELIVCLKLCCINWMPNFIIFNSIPTKTKSFRCKLGCMYSSYIKNKNQ